MCMVAHHTVDVAYKLYINIQLPQTATKKTKKKKVLNHNNIIILLYHMAYTYIVTCMHVEL